jgi:phosphohistidine phosphatase SixA
MNIYLIRHGKAERNQRSGEKELTQIGKEKVQANTNIWKNFIPKFDYLVSSPKTRAVQTAETIAEAYEIKKENFMIDDKVSSGSKVEDIIELANSLDAEDIGFVGHLPDVANHLSDLISNSGMQADFDTGGIAKVTYEGKAKLKMGVLQLLLKSV